MNNNNNVNWPLIERLCRLSFTGRGLTSDEMATLAEAYRQFPEEYIERTAVIRDEERKKISGF